MTRFLFTCTFFTLVVVPTVRSQSASAPPTTLAQVIAKMKAIPDIQPTPELSALGLQIIKNSQSPSLLEVQDFVLAYVNHGKPSDLRDPVKIDLLLTTLDEKYKDDPQMLLPLTQKEAEIVRDTSPLTPTDIKLNTNFKREHEYLLKARKLSDAMRIQQALLALEIIESLGENNQSLAESAAVPAEAAEYRKAAIAAYDEVLAFPFGQPYVQQLREFQGWYNDAAIHRVAISSLPELRELHFHPFAYGAIEDADPERAKLVNGEFTELYDYKTSMLYYLKGQLRDNPKLTPAMREHLEATIAYINRDPGL